MSQSLTLFNKAQMPAHLREAFDGESNIRDRQTVPTLSYEGKVWQVAMNGERTKITRRTEDGEELPTQVMRVVVLAVAERRGRTFYEGAYDPAKPGVPVCWSDDGIAPHPQVQEPKSSKCDTCPLSAKGSKVTEQGKAVTACSQHQMLAVVPHNKLDHQPLRLKLAITSVWDKQSPDLEAQNWFAFDNYRDFLKANGVQHTAMLVTKMKFDPNTPFPKVVFSPDRWLEDHEVAEVKPLIKAPEVLSLLGGTWTPAGADGVKVIEAPKPAPRVVEDEEEPAPVQKPKATKPKAKPAPVIDADDEETAEVITLPAAKAPPVKATPKVTSELPEDLDDLVKGWDDE